MVLWCWTITTLYTDDMLYILTVIWYCTVLYGLLVYKCSMIGLTGSLSVGKIPPECWTVQYFTVIEQQVTLYIQKTKGSHFRSPCSGVEFFSDGSWQPVLPRSVNAASACTTNHNSYATETFELDNVFTTDWLRKRGHPEHYGKCGPTHCNLYGRFSNSTYSTSDTCSRTSYHWLFHKPAWRRLIYDRNVATLAYIICK